MRYNIRRSKHQSTILIEKTSNELPMSIQATLYKILIKSLKIWT